MSKKSKFIELACSNNTTLTKTLDKLPRKRASKTLVKMFLREIHYRAKDVNYNFKIIYRGN